jgi:hypothetical protein
MSLPKSPIPASTKLLDESPSVKISVHHYELIPPASLASYSLGIPVIFESVL